MQLKQKLLTTSLLISTLLFAQPKKPTIMILPSDNWCIQRYFVTDFDNQGTKQKVPNYKQAFQEDAEIGQVISKIGSLMIDRGFDLKDAEQEIKNLEQQSAEDAVTASNASNSSLAESPLDKLKKRAKADIILQIWWKVNTTETGSKSVSFTLEALDAYTSKRIAASTGTSNPSSTDIVPVSLQKAVAENVTNFNKQLQTHFSNIQKNGREIIVRIKRWQNWNKNLETGFNGKELNYYINEWMKKYTVNSKCNTTDATENMMTFDQVKIPLYDANKNPIDARDFIKGLKDYLKESPFNIDAKLMTRGLGEAILVLGEK